MATVNLGRIKLVWQGAYNPSKLYEKDDIIAFKGSSYICIQKGKGYPPTDPLYWQLMASGSDQLVNKGDIVIHDGNKATNLPIGAENSTLRVKDGKPAWGVQDIRAGTTVAKLMQGGNYGNHHVAAFLMNDGTLRAVGRSHDYSNAQSSNNHIYLAQTVCVDPYNPPSSRFKAVYRNYLSFFALSEDGVVYSWGSNHYGMLGHSEDKHQPYAKLVC